jgi:hypothetical protein
MRHGRLSAVGLSALGLSALGVSGLRLYGLAAVGLSVVACSPGGSGKATSVVATNRFDSPNQMQTGTGGTDQGPQTSDQGDLFGADSDLGCRNGCAFTAAPLLDEGVSAADIAPFAASPDFKSGSLCVVEPQLSRDGQPGALFPRNWLRPRFRWTSTGGETLWEIRMHTEGQPEDLRAYTRSVPGEADTQWLVPKDVWKKMREITSPVTVTIRGLGAGGVFTGSSGDFEIAPVDASGSLVFWATTSSLVDYTQASSRLEGFSLADTAKNTETDEGVAETLSAVQVQTGNIPGEDGAKPRGFYACGGDVPRPTCAAQPNNPACCNPTGFQFGEVECVGCHVSTPDGKAVLFTDNWPWDKVAASIEPETRGALPGTITPYASQLLKQPWLGMQALSPAYFSAAGARILITSYGSRPNPGTAPFDPTPPTRHEIAWFDLAANDPANPIPDVIPPDPPAQGQTQNIYQVRDVRNLAVGRARNVSWGLVSTIGETRSAVTPAWSNDGNTIAYVSTDISSTDGHPDWTASEADIHVVPYNSHGGGNMQALAGASDATVLEYYPDFSADDAFLAFVRAPKPTQSSRCVPKQDAGGTVTSCPAVDLGANPDGPYYNRNGEIYIVPRVGGSATRLIANDPVSCTGETARGSINSWPKWSPRVAQQNGKSYYFLMFSSARGYPESFRLPPARLTPAISNKSAQLYMAAVVVDDATQSITTYPALYLWNQNIAVNAQGEAKIVPTSNLTPAWDDFSIPPVPPILKPPR